jgi:hypothetical protein
LLPYTYFEVIDVIDEAEKPLLIKLKEIAVP